MISDLEEPDAKRLLRTLERFDPVVDKFIAPFVPLAKRIAPALARGGQSSSAGDAESLPSSPLELVVMRRRKDFNRLFRAGHFAAFTIPTLTKTVLVVGPSRGRGSLRENLLHEYVHFRLRRDVPGGLPLWFEEGLASFLSQIEFLSVKSKSNAEEAASFGVDRFKYRLGNWRAAELSPDMPLDRLIATRDIHALNRTRLFAFYHTAHAMVRYLYVQKPPETQALAASLVLGEPELENGVGIDFRAAGRAIRSLSGEVLSGGDSLASQRRLEHPETLTGLIERKALNKDLGATIRVDAVAPNVVRQILAESTLLVDAAAAEKLYARILTQQSEELSPLLGYVKALRLQAKSEAAREALNQALELAPDQPAALLEEVELSTSGCIVKRRDECFELWTDAVFVLRDVLDEEPDNFEAIYRLGLAHLYLGQPGEALGYLEISWQRAPWSPRVNYFLGEAMRLLGDSRARWFLSNASRWSATEFFRQTSRMALDELE